MEKIFWIVVKIEQWLAAVFHLTYNEINILVYYLVVPLTWTAIVDWRFLHRPYATLALLAVWAVVFICTRGRFSEWCDWAFKKSVDFLLWFQHIGWNYVVSSVIICVVLPILIYILLLKL